LIIFISHLVLLSHLAVAGSIEVIDSAGRHVRVPESIARILPAGPPAAVLIYALAPDKLIGWVRPLPKDSASLLPARYGQLPVVGRLTGAGNRPSAAAIASLHPDVIVDVGDVEPEYVALADKVQQETGIPYLLFEGRLSRSPDILRQLAGLLGEPAEGRRLADYAGHMLEDVRSGLAQVPAGTRSTVYYARGPNGLQSGPEGSLIGEPLEMAGGRNVVTGNCSRPT
jgi:iron complex transport system substrate-binding protein